MPTTRFWIVLALLGSSSLTAAAAEPFRDEFKTVELAQRRAVRGPWQIADGVARCTQDDELYKKFQDHGPIIFYDVPMTDGVVRFRYRTHGAQTFVFTANGEAGHVFRFVTSARGTDLRAFPPGGDVKSISLARDAEQKLVDDQWRDATVTLRGPTAEVRLGDAQVLKVEHPSLGRSKTNLSLGFSFGTVEISDVSVTQ